jgi:hypothetical protein
MAKLTLHVPDELVIAAKRAAANREISVSKLVSDYFRVLSGASVLDNERSLPPVTASLAGCIAGSDDLDSYVDYLERKHSLGRQ